MYNDEYDDEEEIQNENFIVNFYNNNKLLIWIFGGIIIFILIMSLLTRGGSSSKEELEYDISIEPKEVSVSINTSTNVIATVKNNPNAEIIWSVENIDIAKVDNGNITGLDYGKTRVTATYIHTDEKKYSASVYVTVADGDSSLQLTDVSFKDGDLFMPMNNTYQIALSLTPSRGYIENKVFTSSDTRVVTVDNTGLVTSVGEGDAVLLM